MVSKFLLCTSFRALNIRYCTQFASSYFLLFSFFFLLLLAALLRSAYIIYAFFFRWLLLLLAFNSCVCGIVRVCATVWVCVRSSVSVCACARVYHIEKFSLQSAWYMRTRKYAKKYATQKSLKCKVLTIGKFASWAQSVEEKPEPEVAPSAPIQHLPIHRPPPRCSTPSFSQVLS